MNSIRQSTRSDLQVLQVPPDVYDGFYPSAHAMREMFQYFAEHTCFGPEHAKHIAAANALVPGRKLPRQVDSSKLELPRASNCSRYRAGGRLPSASCGRISL